MSHCAAVARRFAVHGGVEAVAPYGSGHIHDTFRVRMRSDDGSQHRYILQRINQRVFPQPGLLMENIAAVTSHLRAKVAARGGDPLRETLNLVPTLDGDTFHRSSEGDVWRVYLFIDGAHSLDAARSLEHACRAAEAIGSFQRQVEDLPANGLHDTIPGFHDSRMRYAALVEAVRRDPVNRAHLAVREISFVEQREADASVLLNLFEEGHLPERIVHNDTKFGNVMIDDETGFGICVIDLDTVMRGLSLYDFGDMIRSGANRGTEDERNLSRVRVDLSTFDAIVRGYLSAMGGRLTALELDRLAFSAKLMTLECGMRFLTDYLCGDTYFGIQREHHNLDRARAQFKLVQDIEDKLELMMEAVVRHVQTPCWPGTVCCGA